MNLNWKEKISLGIRWKLKYTFKFSDETSKIISFKIYWILAKKIRLSFQNFFLKSELDVFGLEEIRHDYPIENLDFLNTKIGKPKDIINWKIVNKAGLQENFKENNFKDWYIAHYNNLSDILSYNEMMELVEVIFGKSLRKYYNSEFRILNIGMYITKENKDNKLENSFLWHIDNHPPGLIKGFVYLSDTTIDNGPFTSLLRSHQINHSNNQDETQSTDYRFSKSYISSLKIEPYHVVGKKGKSFLVNANVLHRAFPVHYGERRVLTFMFLPSVYSCSEHLKRYGTLESCDSPDRIHEPLWNWK